jgi:exopolysaccharide biosynthesis polyprenyl glycosylphosphotransferase
MKNNFSVIYALGLVFADFLALIAAFGLAYVFRVSLDARPLINKIGAYQYLKIWFALTPIWILIFASLGLYRKSLYEYRIKEFAGLLLGSVLGIMTVISYDFASKVTIFPARLVPVYALGLSITLLFIERTIMRGIRTTLWRWGYGISRVLVIGDGKPLANLIKSMNSPKKTGYKIIGIVSEKANSSFNGKHFNSIAEAASKINALKITSIIFVASEKNTQEAEYALALAQSNHLSFKFVPAHEGILSNKVEVELFQSLPVVSIHQTALLGWGRIAKRLFDIVFALIALIILSPVFLLIALVIYLSDFGNPFFKQNRLSRFNATISIYKFRSMKKKYSGLSPEQAFEKMGKPELSKKYRENGDMLKNDPRVTVVGKILRITSLDELPQLYNILRGDISLVGPRALVPEELENYPYKNLILSVKSGLTGLAQTSGRRDISFEERRALDLYYVQNWSFWLDLKIIFRTFKDVLGGRGAR